MNLIITSILLLFACSEAPLDNNGGSGGDGSGYKFT